MNAIEWACVRNTASDTNTIRTNPVCIYKRCVSGGRCRAYCVLLGWNPIRQEIGNILYGCIDRSKSSLCGCEGIGVIGAAGPGDGIDGVDQRSFVRVGYVAVENCCGVGEGDQFD